MLQQKLVRCCSVVCSTQPRTFSKIATAGSFSLKTLLNRPFISRPMKTERLVFLFVYQVKNIQVSMVNVYSLQSVITSRVRTGLNSERQEQNRNRSWHVKQPMQPVMSRVFQVTNSFGCKPKSFFTYKAASFCPTDTDLISDCFSFFPRMIYVHK